MLKLFLRWFIFGLSLLFILKIFWQNGAAFSHIQLSSSSLCFLFFALIITLLAHIWSGYIWYIILKQLNLKNIDLLAILSLYLRSNIYKYIPGNIGHFYLRIATLREAGHPLSLVTLGVILEPILMALAAFWVSLFSLGMSFKAQAKPELILIEISSFILILFLLQPKILNQVLSIVGRIKNSNIVREEIKEYPLLPLLGEVLFILLRGGGFILTAAAFGLTNFRELMGAFSLAWLCGLVIPGAPGGLGVFEASLIALLPQNNVTSLLGVVAVFRIISLTAELIGALSAQNR